MNETLHGVTLFYLAKIKTSTCIQHITIPLQTVVYLVTQENRISTAMDSNSTFNDSNDNDDY